MAPRRDLRYRGSVRKCFGTCHSGHAHERLGPHLRDALVPFPDAIELERRLALAPPVVARLHREAEITEAILPLEVHAIERVGDPADPALAEHDVEVRIALEHRRA